MKSIIDLYEASLLDIEGTLDDGNIYSKATLKDLLKVKSEAEFIKLYNCLKIRITSDAKKPEVNKFNNINVTSSKRYICFDDKNTRIFYGFKQNLYMCYWKNNKLENVVIPNYTINSLKLNTNISRYDVYVIPIEFENSEKVLQSSKNLTGTKYSLAL